MAKKEPVTIYHNPRCSKSRQALELLRQRGVEPSVVEYLDEPFDERQLKALLEKLAMRPIDLIRKKEKQFATLGLARNQSDDAALIAAMTKHPILIERPIVVKGAKAVVGRPPDRALEIL